MMIVCMLYKQYCIDAAIVLRVVSDLCIFPCQRKQ